MAENTKNRVQQAKSVVIGCAVLAAIFISGLQYFVLNLPRQMASPAHKSDGIVVITGHTGLGLLVLVLVLLLFLIIFVLRLSKDIN